jgi:hypothetical protein
VAGGRDVGGQVGGQRGHALLRRAVHADVGLSLCGVLAAVGGGGVELQQQFHRPLAHPAGGQPRGLGQQPGLHLAGQRGAGVFEDLHQ